IDAKESFEHDRVLYAGEDWGPPSEGQWKADTDWQGNTFTDTYAMCWGGSPAPIPPTVTGNPNGNGAAINSDTQKYWMGSLTDFQGECSQRHAITWYTDHVILSNITTPITDPTVCAQGQYANL